MAGEINLASSSGDGKAPVEDNSKKVDLVFEGGGVKGIALVGALAVLEEQGYQPQYVAGTSAGAICAALVAAGYKASEVHEIIANLDFNKLRDTAWEDDIPVFGAPLSLLKDQGIYEGRYLQDLMSDLLKAKNIVTFRDLVHEEFGKSDDWMDPKYKYKLQVIASDLTGRCMLSLPNDAAKLGIDPDDLNVAWAVRMSMSIPIFFEPVWFPNPKTGEQHLIVDGGMLSDYPVWLFDSPGIPSWPTFGLRLVEPDAKANIGEQIPEWQVVRRGGIQGALTYMKALVGTMTGFYDRLYIEKADFARTIPISTLGVSSIDFGLPRERIDALYESGREAGEKFLSTWSFDGYIEAFRTGKEYHRTEEVARIIEQGGEPSPTQVSLQSAVQSPAHPAMQSGLGTDGS